MNPLIKPFILIAILLITLPSGVFAQKHELSVGYGYLTKEQFHNDIFNLNKAYTGPSGQEQIISELFDGSGLNAYLNDPSRTGVISLSYKHAFTSRIKAGFVLAVDNEHGDITVYEKAAKENRKVGSYSRTAVSIAAEGKVIYVTKGLISIYGLLGIGTCFASQSIKGNDKVHKHSSNYFTLQATPIGLSIGKKIQGFIETGFGYKGICHAGILASF